MKDTTSMSKQNFNEKLIALLKTNPDFTDESDELLPAAVKDHAWKLDHNLIRLLLSDPQIKSTFFDKIDGHWVFNHNTFIDYISAKNFLADSYTQFRNKIGLNIAENFFLNWYVNAETTYEAIEDFKAIDDLEAQRHCLVELLDKNQLYVNLSEIEDADFAVSAEDKALNKMFYGE